VKFTTVAKDLAAATGAAAELIDPKNTMVILTMLRLDAADGKIAVAAHTLDECLTARCAAEVAEPGSVLVDADRLATLLGSLPGEVHVKAEVKRASPHRRWTRPLQAGRDAVGGLPSLAHIRRRDRREDDPQGGRAYLQGPAGRRR